MTAEPVGTYFFVTVRDGAFDCGGGRAEVFRLEPVRGFGFAKDEGRDSCAAGASRG